MAIEFKQVNFKYNSILGSVQSLSDINLNIKDGEFIAVIGHTGSGKSTLIQQINAILQPLSGSVKVNEYVIDSKKLKNIKDLRKVIGMSFQFSESQLFEETVLKDVMFGPINFGYTKDEATNLSKAALNIVGIDESIFDKSPFELSGGQMRRVAIAGILSYDPDILILDEPTAGLDPIGQLQVLNLLKHINDLGKTVIVIMHDLNHVVEYTKRVVMLEDGEIVYDGLVNELFSNDDLVNTLNIKLPYIYDLSNKLKINSVSNYNEFIEELVKQYG